MNPRAPQMSSADTHEAYGDMPAPHRFPWAPEAAPVQLPKDFFWSAAIGGFGLGLGVGGLLAMCLVL